MPMAYNSKDNNGGAPLERDRGYSSSSSSSSSSAGRPTPPPSDDFLGGVADEALDEHTNGTRSFLLSMLMMD
jgi:hypothetical protein